MGLLQSLADWVDTEYWLDNTYESLLPVSYALHYGTIGYVGGQCFCYLPGLFTDLVMDSDDGQLPTPSLIQLEEAIHTENIKSIDGKPWGTYPLVAIWPENEWSYERLITAFPVHARLIPVAEGRLHRRKSARIAVVS